MLQTGSPVWTWDYVGFWQAIVWCVGLMWSILHIDIYTWVVRLVSKNGHQNNIMRYDDVRLCDQNMSTILGSITSILRGPMWSLRRQKNSSLWPFITFASLLQFWIWNDNVHDVHCPNPDYCVPPNKQYNAENKGCHSLTRIDSAPTHKDHTSLDCLSFLHIKVLRIDNPSGVWLHIRARA